MRIKWWSVAGLLALAGSGVAYAVEGWQLAIYLAVVSVTLMLASLVANS